MVAFPFFFPRVILLSRGEQALQRVWTMQAAEGKPGQTQSKGALLAPESPPLLFWQATSTESRQGSLSGRSPWASESSSAWLFLVRLKGKVLAACLR